MYKTHAHIVKLGYGQKICTAEICPNKDGAQHFGKKAELGAWAKYRIYKSDRERKEYALTRGAVQLLRLFQHFVGRIFRGEN